MLVQVGNIIEDPFNMPFLFGKKEAGQHHDNDELKLERSFINIRGDIMDPSPASIPLASEEEDYDVARFHRPRVWDRDRADHN
jgi:hypothetical protein